MRYLKFAGLKFVLSRHQVGEERSTSTAKFTAGDDVDDEVARYFAEMGVRDPVMPLTLATPSKTIRWLTADELKRSRLATAWIDGAKPIVDLAQPGGLRWRDVRAAALALVATLRQAGRAVVS